MSETKNQEGELRKPISMRLSSEGMKLLEGLTKKLGVNRTAVIEMAIRQIAEKENVAAQKKHL